MPSTAKNFNNINLLSEENVKKNILPQYDLANADIKIGRASCRERVS